MSNKKRHAVREHDHEVKNIRPSGPPIASQSGAAAAPPNPQSTQIGQERAILVTPPPAMEPQPGASIRFASDWRHALDGELVAGGKLTIEFDPNRAQLKPEQGVSSCAWGVQAFVKMNPSGKVIEREAVDIRTEKVGPLNSPKALPLTVDIPHGTTEIEVWFKNWTQAERHCESWDSNFGKNYRFSVQSQ